MPRMIGTFCFQDETETRRETQETQYFEIAWTKRINSKFGELIRYGNLNSPQKEHIPKVERININRLLLHGRHEVEKRVVESYWLARNLQGTVKSL